MYDHEFVDDDGKRVPVSRMSDADIHACLNGGVHPLDGEIDEHVLERLRIEVLIRALGLHAHNGD